MPEHHYTLQDFDQIFDLSRRLALFFPQPNEVHSGIYELLINALEHGNLGIGYETKTTLLKENRWLEEIRRRLAEPHNREKVVWITVSESPDGCTLTITDQGSGFDWKTYLHSPPPAQHALHGRGLRIAKHTGMPMRFNETGNQITLVASN